MLPPSTDWGRQGRRPRSRGVAVAEREAPVR
ncbi:hypothetical protein DAI22_08g165700 [Oryza sativa Japonica Group]|nr:hypothetical protein DAI22_08g165700 [Oryza sativa Japonica Group]